MLALPYISFWVIILNEESTEHQIFNLVRGAHYCVLYFLYKSKSRTIYSFKTSQLRTAKELPLARWLTILMHSLAYQSPWSLCKWFPPLLVFPSIKALFPSVSIALARTYNASSGAISILMLYFDANAIRDYFIHLGSILPDSLLDRRGKFGDSADCQ